MPAHCIPGLIRITVGDGIDDFLVLLGRKVKTVFHIFCCVERIEKENIDIRAPEYMATIPFQIHVSRHFGNTQMKLLVDHRISLFIKGSKDLILFSKQGI